MNGKVGVVYCTCTYYLLAKETILGNDNKIDTTHCP